MIRISIDNPEVTTRSGVAKATGKPYTVREQEGWAYMYDKNGRIESHPRAIKINLRETEPAYAVGDYILQAQSLYVGKFGSLEVGSLVLVKAPAQAIGGAPRVA